MLATANNQLASSLFCYTGTTQYRPVSIPNILEAANNARRRWPDLAGMADRAVVLVAPLFSPTCFPDLYAPSLIIHAVVPGTWGTAPYLSASGRQPVHRQCLRK